MRHCDRDTVSERFLRGRGESATTGTKADQRRRAFSGAVRTTGENPTLTHAEHLRVVEITIEEAKGRVPVLAGAAATTQRK